MNQCNWPQKKLAIQLKQIAATNILNFKQPYCTQAYRSKGQTKMDCQPLGELVKNFVSVIIEHFEPLGMKSMELMTKHLETVDKASIEPILPPITHTPETPVARNPPKPAPSVISYKPSPPVGTARPPASIGPTTARTGPLKRPRSAYNMFVKSESVKIKKQFPEMSAPDIVRTAAQRYRKLNEAEKQVYVHQFELEKQRFDERVREEQMSQYDGRRGRKNKDYTLQ